MPCLPLPLAVLALSSPLAPLPRTTSPADPPAGYDPLRAAWSPDAAHRSAPSRLADRTAGRPLAGIAPTVGSPLTTGGAPAVAAPPALSSTLLAPPPSAPPGSLGAGATWSAASAHFLSVDVTSDEWVRIDGQATQTDVLAPLPSSTISALAWDAERATTWALDSFGGNLWRLDGAGTVTLVGSTGVGPLVGLECDRDDGRLYALDGFTRLYELDPATGAATLIGATGLTHLSSLAQHPQTGEYFAAYAWSTADGWLATLDVQTAQVTSLVATRRLTGLAFDEAGNLFGVDNGSSSTTPSSLYWIQPQTGASLLVGSSSATNLLALDLRAPESPRVACAATPNSTGARALASWSGEASLSAPTLHLELSHAPPHQPALLLFGDAAGAAVFGNGTLCLAPGWTRSALARTNAGGHATRALADCLPTLGPRTPWSLVWCQWAYRDPGVGVGFDVSDALRVPLLP